MRQIKSFKEQIVIYFWMSSCCALIVFLSSCSGQKIDLNLQNEALFGGLRTSLNSLPTPCASTVVTEGVPFSCPQSGEVDEIWMFDTTHTCTFMFQEHELGNYGGTAGPEDIALGTCVFSLFVLDDDTIGGQTYSTVLTFENAAPILSIGGVSIGEDSPLTLIRSDVDVQANEEGFGQYSLLPASIVGTPKCSDVGTVDLDVDNGETQFKPGLNFVGDCFIRVGFDDGLGAVNSEVESEFKVTVSPINDPPILQSSIPSSVVEDDMYMGTATAIDPDEDTITYALDPSATCTWVNVSPTGIITGVPNDDDVGTCDIVLTATDGITISDLEVITIEVVNVRPTLEIHDVSIAVGLGVTIIHADGLVEASDEDYGVYAFDHINTPGINCVDNGVLTINTSSGEITFDPDNAYAGYCNIRVTFDDQNTQRNIGYEDFSVEVGDSTAPDLTIDVPIPMTYVTSNNESLFSVSGICSEIGRDVRVDFGGFTQFIVCAGVGTYSATFDVSGLVDTNIGYLLEVEHSDVAGNVSTADLVILKDTTADDTINISLKNPVPPENEGIINNPDITVAGLPGDVDTVEIFSDASCTSSLASVSSVGVSAIDISLALPTNCTTYELYAQYTDLRGNVSDCSADMTTYYYYGRSRTLTVAPATSVDEYQVLVTLDASFDYANTQTDGDDLRFFDTTGSLLDYWVERFETGGDSKIWVQLPLLGTTDFEMQYCQPGVESKEEQLLTFDYSVQRDLYANMRGTGSLAIASYVPTNDVTPTTSTLQTIGQFAVNLFGSVPQGVIQSKGPLSGRIQSSSGYDSIAPFSSAGKVLGYPISRSATDTWDLYNPSSSIANVTMTGYDASGVLMDTQSFTLASSSFTTRTLTGSIVNLVESDKNINGHYVGGTSDAVLAYDASTEIYGVSSNGAHISTAVDGTTGTVYGSDGSMTSFSINKGELFSLAAGGVQGTAPAQKVVANNPIFGASQADSDGSESASFVPLSELDSFYIIPNNTQYIAVACPYQTTLELFNSSGVLLQTVSCTPVGNFPGKAFFGNAATNTVAFTAGARISGDQVFYVYYEYENQDESNVLGPKHGRIYLENPPSITLGAPISL